MTNDAETLACLALADFYNEQPTMNKITTFSEYSRAAASTQMESCRGLDYLELGFVGEVCGELCGELIAKSIRGDFKLIDKAPEVRDESGDACWFADTTCVAHGTSLATMLWCDDIDKVDKQMWKSAVASGFDKLSDYEIGKQLAFYSCSVMAFGGDLDALSRNLQLFFAHLVVLLHRYGFTLLDAINCNVEKLAKRKERGLIMGSGDHR